MWLLLACTVLTPPGTDLPDTLIPDTGIPDTGIPDPPLPSGLTVLDHVAIVDADGRRDNRAVLLLDGRIERVTESGAAWPADADVIDATGLTVIPGLVDSHVHLATAGTTEPVGDMLEVNLRATLAAGVTEVVDLGGPISLFALRDAIDRGDAIGPRIHAAGPFLTVVGSHPCETFPDPTLCTFVDASDAASVAATRVAEGADLLKVALADAAFTPWGATPRLDLDSLDAIAAAGLPVWAHVDADDDVVDAVEHGVSVLAHPAFAAPMGPDAVAAAARADAITSTVSAFANVGKLSSLVAPDPAIQANWDAVAADPGLLLPGFVAANATWDANVRANLRTLHAEGARVLPGSDAGYYFVPHGTGLLDELDAMVTLGWTPLEALTAATVDAHAVLGEDGGRIEAGATADLVLITGDPSADLAALRHVHSVYLRGVRWDPLAELSPGVLETVCLDASDCAPDEACDALLHACNLACDAPYDSDDTRDDNGDSTRDHACGADAWCMPEDGTVTDPEGVCHEEPPCDLYNQDCTPEAYGLACVPYDTDTNACWYGGARAAGQTCSWDNAGLACAPGLFCSHIDAHCYTLCDPEAPDSCTTGRCRQQFSAEGAPWFGLCY